MKKLDSEQLLETAIQSTKNAGMHVERKRSKKPDNRNISA